MTMVVSTEDVQDALSTLPGWKCTENVRIEKEFSFDSFPDAIAFVNKVADIAETVEHHPDIDIRYTKVRIALSTHDAGGVTEKDMDFAKSIKKIQV